MRTARLSTATVQRSKTGPMCPGMSTNPNGHTHPEVPIPPTPADRMTDRRLWKHYIPTISFGGNNK